MTSTPHENYKYQRLYGSSSFRLLELKAGIGDEPLEGNLQVHDLGSDIHAFVFDIEHGVLDFQALSYVWGSGERTHNITCNGKSLAITENLRDALRRVRLPTNNIMVWADAICVDQLDLKERKMQVALMRTIFSKARCVSICLRLDENISTQDRQDLARILLNINSMKKRAARLVSSRAGTKSILTGNLKEGSLHSKATPTTKSQLGFHSKQLQRPESRMWSQPWYPVNQIKSEARRTTPHSDNPLLNISSSSCPLLVNFFDNIWFSRIWVIQEVAESQTARVLLDDQEIPWQNVVELAHTLLSDPLLGGYVLRAAKTQGLRNVLFMHNRMEVPTYDPIPSMLQRTRDFGASDPRDKVYAMLHTPIRKTRTYTKFMFLNPYKYIEFFAQTFVLFNIWTAIAENRPTESRFWCLTASLGCMAYFLRFDQAICTIAWDLLQRMVNFCLLFHKVILRDVQLTNTLCTTLSIAADYSLTVHSLYNTVATRVIERSGKLNILSYANHGRDLDPTYPSWVPRWDIATDGIQVLVDLPKHQYRSSADIYHTSRPSPQHVDHLLVEGVQFSTICSVSHVSVSSNFSQSPFSVQHASSKSATVMREFDGGEEYLYPTGESIRKVRLAVLTAGRLGHVNLGMTRYTGEGRNQNGPAIAQTVCHGRRIFVTENGFMGIGPTAIRKGDVVSVLFGGAVPYILRATESDGMYRLVGESYVHGIMNGEVIQSWLGGRLAKSQFKLC